MLNYLHVFLWIEVSRNPIWILLLRKKNFSFCGQSKRKDENNECPSLTVINKFSWTCNQFKCSLKHYFENYHKLDIRPWRSLFLAQEAFLMNEYGYCFKRWWNFSHSKANYAQIMPYNKLRTTAFNRVWKLKRTLSAYINLMIVITNII